MKSIAMTLMVAVLASVSFGQATAPYFESFDGASIGSANCLSTGVGTLPAGWTDGGGTGSWTVWSGGTGSTGTGPSGDVNGSGNYMYTETSSGCSSNDFILVSPMVDMSGIASPAVSFRVHMLGSDFGDLVIEETDGAGGWVEIGRISGELGNDWYFTEYALTQSMTQVRFTLTGAAGFLADAGLDNVNFGENNGIGNNFPAPAVPTAPEFEGNSPISNVDVDGVIGVTASVGDFNVFSANSSTPGALYEIFINAGQRRGLSQGGLATGGLQAVNVDLNPANLVLFNAATFGSAQPHPGTISFNVFGGSAFSGCAQQLVVDGSSADGYDLSAACELNYVNVQGANGGPTGDDSVLNVVFSAGLTVPFMGTVYSDAWINSNGSITFGGSDFDFSPSVTDALFDDARLGVWTDFNPSAGGFITWDESATQFDVYWQGVPYFGEATGSDMVLSVDSTGVATIDVSQWRANPGTSTGASAGDAVWMGISGGFGLGATDGGATSFTAGGMGMNALATDMIYDFVGAGDINNTAVRGQIDSITNLNTGAGILTFVPGVNPGEYSWSGL